MKHAAPNLTDEQLTATAKAALEGETAEDRFWAVQTLLCQAQAYRAIAHSEKARADRRSPFTVVTGEKR